MSSEVSKYWPEEIVGTGELVVYASDYVELEDDYAALEAENARLTAQLAAIQGGRGEVLCAELKACAAGRREDSPHTAHLMDRAAHAIAAMAAEVEQWERNFRDIHEPALRDAHAYIQELRAECKRLAEALDRQSVITGDYIARCQRLADELAITRRVIDRIGQLCTTPHESKERFIRRVQSVIEWERAAQQDQPQ